LGRYFQAVFIPLVPQLRNEFAFLGHFILIQMAIAVLLLGRRVPDPGFGFIPAWREWRIGVVHYLWFAVLGLPLALLMKAVHLRAAPAPAWSVLGTLVGYLWVVALSEEFFFRGVLQQWIGNWTRSASRALLITSVLFGLIHLGYRRFPNWRWVLVATLLGWCCGRARNQAGNIRAAVVTHALAVATWRGFFS
jgi:membrane protease YdiL (CAAX protease family)